ncbi:MAG: BatA domain-containing protein [Gemmatimonadaceae bacterium]
MTLLAPGFLIASLALAAGIVALHFIVTRQPRAGILPTARFVPDTPATTVAAARRPSDLLVLLLRVLLVVAAGTGLAKPVLTPSRGAQGRVILVDVSRSTRDARAIRDTARAWWRPQDAVVLFDSSAWLLGGDVADSLRALAPTVTRGNLSGALIAALRAASSLRDHADSLALVIISPFATEEFDAATDSIRQLWPGRAILVRIPNATGDTVSVIGQLGIRADTGDVLSVTVGIARSRSTNRALIDRGNATGSSEPRDDILIAWPASDRPRFAVQRSVTDTVGGVIAGDARVVAPFVRQWSFPPDSVRGAEVIARWADGQAAAIEKSNGGGCTRSVAIPVTEVGDFAIRPDFIDLVATLSGPCISTKALIPAEPARVARLEGKGGLAPRQAFAPVTDTHSALAPWLFAVAIAAAIGELFVRRRGRSAKARIGEGAGVESGEARAA